MWLEVYFVLASLLGYVAPHGYLQQPAGRSSMWRFGYDNPKNYDDNGLNCGGFSTQFNTNDGKCGVCGDPYNAEVKENEAGGKYANGIITKTYQSGDSIKAEVRITANHLGYFEFRLCPHNNLTSPVTQACLDQHLLSVENGPGLVTQYYIGSTVGIISMTLGLPKGVTCSQCVLQWTYSGENNWGCDGLNDCGKGKGDQEQFVNCADIAIVSRSSPTQSPQGNQSPPTTPSPSTGHPTQAPTAGHPTQAPTTASPTQAPQTIDHGNCRGVGVWADFPWMTIWCKSNCIRDFCPASHCDCSAPGSVPTRLTCQGVGVWSMLLSTWCDANCNHVPSFCPASHCACSVPTRRTCRGVGVWTMLSTWCDANCNQVRPNCPESRCQCS